MPQRAKGPRLYLRSARPGRPASWVILDAGREFGTGCGAGEREAAETALAEHLARTRLQSIRKGDPSQIAIADVLTLYMEQRAPYLARPDVVASVAPLLLAHAGEAMCDRITKGWCEAYVRARVSGKIAPAAPAKGKPFRLPKASSVARDLEVLSAALGHARDEGVLAWAPKVHKPKAAPPRFDYLTRSEVAAMLWACWRDSYRDAKGRKVHPHRHLCRFILFGIYTGTRPGTVTNASFAAASGRSWIDADRGVFYRLPDGAQDSATKLRPSVPIPARLLAHVRRWRASSPGGWLVTFEGAPVLRVKKAFAWAVRRAGVSGKAASPHILRHTFMTWTTNGGLSLQDAVRLAGMTMRTGERTYAHLDTGRREEFDRAIHGRNLGGRRNIRTGTDG